MRIVVGCVVNWGQDGRWGVVEGIEQGCAAVGFDDGTTLKFSTDGDAIERIQLHAASQVMRANDGVPGVVLEAVGDPDTDNPAWVVVFADASGQGKNAAEAGLRPYVPHDPLQRAKTGRWGTTRDFNLKSVAADYWTTHLHNELVCLAHSRVDLQAHQVSVVHRVITRYPHRFMLCDEVGLGKTIEAAMIVKELRARKAASRILILVPSGLTRQWQFELKTKFNEVFAIYNTGTIRYLQDNGVAEPWMHSDSIIASHGWASWSPERRKSITDVPWDMVIVDEAHHARERRQGNRAYRTLLFRLVAELVARPESVRRAALFLTASPMQLDTSELYSLCEMLDPVLFASLQDFNKHLNELSGLNRTVEALRALGPGESPSPEVVEDVARFLDSSEEAVLVLDAVDGGRERLIDRLAARHRLSEVLIRNRKSVVGGFQPRHASRWEVDLTPREKTVHELMDDILQKGFRRADLSGQSAVGFLMVIYQKLLASSSRALLASLRKRRERVLGQLQAAGLSEAGAELALDDENLAADVVGDLGLAAVDELTDLNEAIAAVEQVELDTKAKVLLANMDVLRDDDPECKVLIFTEFRETQDFLAGLLIPHWGTNIFNGQMTANEKDAAVDRFREGAGPQVLISTEAGGEGRNFQFCHIIVNYDLPWNPMRVEQRIGRVDRIGQEHPVSIFNFHVQGTIEGRVLDVLDRRIHVFEQAVGGLDPILGEAESDIRDALKLVREERDKAMQRLGEQLEKKVNEARKAERELADFIMDSKSYSQQIVEWATQQRSEITSEQFEKFLITLLIANNTHIGPFTADGVREIYLHPPVTTRYPELTSGQEKRQVCFNPHLKVDSESVEYLGFGHPVVDVLVDEQMADCPDGGACVRCVDGEALEIDGPGWQFNWLMRISGLRSTELVVPMFVGDDGSVDFEAGRRLLKSSRDFGSERWEGDRRFPDSALAHEQAMAAASSWRDRALDDKRQEARDRAEVEEKRIQALYEHRKAACDDRIASCQATLLRLAESDDPDVKRIAPVWQANLRRAQAELQAVEDDLEQSLVDLNRRRTPSGEFNLLNVARIELAPRLDEEPDGVN